ncbi:polysaccharide pyruvyl transferase family protein [Nitrogeniibacter mangrovi]|uniref:Polysaccharide pyruvyl transferase family protein n=1 Tax=Nitrogeniibacter mangrovi TaxID=2016596 RepID=A0A6C1AZJ2_9RHOO|nr:polysaccharide pyruvyl transferase family protein [Nitrogeniibacter mangrovi]QID16772.1 polysaccharide pyruvyl transferase family protein [Nitrogeniibacter mangrovi]
MKFYLAGQREFANRGCEALVRSTVQMLHEQFGSGIEIYCPSDRPDLDSAQWPSAAEHGVRFVPAPRLSPKLKWWYRSVRVAPPIMDHWIPKSFELPDEVARPADMSDVIIQIGGDNITLDYTPAGLIGNTAFSEMYMAKGKPNVLWAASVGPFAKNPRIERYMAGFLARLHLITVREPVSQAYLSGIGVERNVRRVADPAFLMTPEVFDCDPMFPSVEGAGYVGINFSPLVARFAPDDEGVRARLEASLVDFVSSVIGEDGFSVLLVPHVDPLDGSGRAGDTAFMTPLFETLRARFPDRIALAPKRLNAAQLKYLIGRCRFFMGARTHSTIAAFSTGVPTGSIAYSVKARGLNQDIFGHEDFVVSTLDLDAERLKRVFRRMVEREDETRAILQRRIAEIKAESRLSAHYVSGLLQ